MFLASDEAHVTNCPTSWALAILGLLWQEAKSDLSSAGIRWKERERSLLRRFRLPDLNGGGQGISSVPFVPDRCSGIICGYESH